jgi:hypothetical protein
MDCRLLAKRISSLKPGSEEAGLAHEVAAREELKKERTPQGGGALFWST